MSNGKLDAPINNEGVTGPTGAVDDIHPEDRRCTTDVCLTVNSPVCAMRGPMLTAAGRGSIVNLPSAAGRLGDAFRTPLCGIRLNRSFGRFPPAAEARRSSDGAPGKTIDFLLTDRRGSVTVFQN